MNRNHIVSLSAAAVALMAGVCPALASGVPIGSREFYPSPEHPVGWRGDGTAVYPGATPVTNWDVVKGVNVRWKTSMPGLANSQPIVVGEKVFTTAEPRFLICCDLKTGAILWQADMDPLEIQGVPSEEVSKAKKLYPLFAELREIQLTTGIAGTRSMPLEKGRVAWRQVREVLLAMQAVGFPGLTVTVPTEAQIDAETNFEHSRLNDLINGPQNWVGNKYGFRLAETWPTDGGFTLPAPVSDGKYVYVVMGQGQVVACDLTGRKAWGRFIARNKDAGNCSFYPSPILVGDLLIVQNNCMLRAFNTADGKTVWETPHAGPGGGYCIGTAHVLRPDGKTALLVTATGPILRVADGKEIGTTGISNCGSEWGGVSVVGDGKDTVYLFPGNNSGGDLVALQIALAGEMATVTERWKAQHKNRSITPVLYEGLIYHSNDDKAMVVRDTATGEIVKPLEIRTRWPSPAIAGRHLFVGLGDGSVQVATIGREAVPVCVKRLVEANNKCPGGISETAPTFAGDVVILRTHGFLYCFGNK